MARKKFKLVPYAPACPACGTPMLSVGCNLGSGGWWCPEERRAVSDPTPLCETRPCSFGRAYVLGYLALVDERPEIIASGLPFFLASEWDGMPQLPPAERKVKWDRACRATIAERADRERDPKRTITRGSNPAAEPAAIGW